MFYSMISWGQNIELVKDINLDGYSNPRLFVENDNLLYFIANDGVHGYEYWVTDGTSDGTKLLKDIGPLYPIYPISYDNKLYFKGYTDEDGDALWVTDGTESGTQLFKDFNSNNNFSPLGSFVVFKDKLYFGTKSGGYSVDLWVTDGTEGGTYLVKDFSTISNYSDGLATEMKPIVFGDKFYFFAHDCIDKFDIDNCNGWALWSSDGTESGTQIVKDINPTNTSLNYLGNLTVCNDKLYFTGNDGVHGTELWVTDGTESGTQMVKDIISGDGFGNPYELITYNDKLYFNANDGIHGTELWVTDGTEGGTNMVKDILPGEDFGSPINMTLFNNKIYFSARSNASRYDLYVSDGTENGTQVVTSKKFLNHSSNLTVFNDKLYFLDGNNERKLWVTDGTDLGTYELAPSGSFFDPLSDTTQLMVFQNALYLAANWSSQGSELWRITDSSLSNTKIQMTSNLLIFPNPTSNELFIKGGPINEKNLTIELIDVLGKTTVRLAKEPSITNNSEISVDLSNIANGLYIITIKSNDSIIHRSKIIKTD